LRLAASGNHAPEGMHRVHKDKYSWRRAAELTRDVYERVVTAARNDTRVK
jgi:hypothetical protein